MWSECSCFNVVWPPLSCFTDSWCKKSYQAQIRLAWGSIEFASQSSQVNHAEYFYRHNKTASASNEEGLQWLSCAFGKEIHCEVSGNNSDFQLPGLWYFASSCKHLGWRGNISPLLDTILTAWFPHFANYTSHGSFSAAWPLISYPQEDTI